MVPRTLSPKLELLREEYVLVQAWKKTAAYIRRHNWFGDTLELDLKAVDLRCFLDEIRSDLQSPANWQNRSLRLVLAPKSQDWWVPKAPETPPAGWNDRWQPRAKDCGPELRDVTKKLRPLAHVALRDQVVATALMLCLADRVETAQGDPRPSEKGRTPPPRSSAGKRIPFMSYGNRLFCDWEAGELRHRWGSTKLYRSFYQDYREFLAQPHEHAERVVRAQGERRTFLVKADIKRFYDQVTPEALRTALHSLKRPDDDPLFFELASRVFCWEWHEADQEEVARYAHVNSTRDLDRIALPQGLISAGFWANVALLRFDEALRAKASWLWGPRIEYACRYVDDFRLVVTAADDEIEGDSPKEAESSVAADVANSLKDLLDEHADGLELNEDESKKTEAEEIEVRRPGAVLQSQRMNRIQNRVSVGFSASEGLELLEAIQGLLMIRSGFTRDFDESQWEQAPKPDVPEDTRARFGAYRYRKVVRDIRAMLPDPPDDESAGAARARPGTSTVTRSELDEMTRAFALVLVEKWVNDPSNVRILLTALDLWPDSKVLTSVLDLLRPWTKDDMGLPDAQRVAWYCLSELFRAGATETGLFGDADSRPAELSLAEYRRVLIGEAWEVVEQTQPALPWYLRQQAQLLLFTSESYSARLAGACRVDDPKHYRRMASMLAARSRRPAAAEFAQYAIVLHRCFRKQVPGARWTATRMKELARRDPAFAADVLGARHGQLDKTWSDLAKDLLVDPGTLHPRSLARLVVEKGMGRDEPTLLRLSLLLLDTLKEREAVAPWEVVLHAEEKEARNADDFPWTMAEVRPMGASDLLDLWKPPDYSSPEDRWRYQLGYLLRFALSRSPDFTANVNRSRELAAPHYRSAVSSWAQRRYGGNHKQGAFGGDWLPVSDWFERFLSALLWWPGRREDEHCRQIDQGMETVRAWIERRRTRLDKMAGTATGVPFLPMAFSSRHLPQGLKRLRGCVVQPTYPAESDFDGDLTLSSEASRSRHRNHLTDVLALVRQALRTRLSDPPDADDGLLDLLVLPELAVHPTDVRRYLLPFARAFKTIVLAGVVYEELQPETTHLVNTAVWIIPEHSSTGHSNVRIRRQGKRHLAEPEQGRRHLGLPLKGYRPCQWIIECPSSVDLEEVEPLRLSASVCYDATDIRLVADLREESDVYLIPALNKDVATFDTMAVALSFQMHQLVVVANNGRYGGSSAYWPIGEAHERRIMHLHGQNQPTLAFFEISDVLGYRRGRVENLSEHYRWKSPPAGYTKK